MDSILGRVILAKFSDFDALLVARDFQVRLHLLLTIRKSAE